MIRKISALLLAFLLFITLLPLGHASEEEPVRIRILYTGDIHSGFENAGRMKSLIERLSDENTIYVDSGDIAMGTLLQAGFSTDAFELRLLGALGCNVVTVGNHEWDYGGFGFAEQLNTAASYKAQGEALPLFVQSNLDFSGELTAEQQTVKDALANYGASEYTILTVGGKKLAIFGLLGENAVEDSPTSGMSFRLITEAAKDTVRKLQETEAPDCIICLSHSGTSGDGATGEDFELIHDVPGIDVVISGHSHTAYPDAIPYENSLLVSSGSDMNYLGCLDLLVGDDGVSLAGNELIPVSECPESDPEIDAMVSGFYQSISETYLSDYGAAADDVIAHCSFDFMSLDDMYACHQEFPMGELIADSYLYEAKQNGISNIDVAFVALGTIRGSFSEGDITVADAFRVCSLGVGSDGSAGHPILCGYITGKELKLLCELDASLAPMVSSIKMSYANLNMTFNDKRVLLDRVTDVRLVRADGSTEELEDDRLYYCACNMYAVNMLGMLNNLTHGALKIVAKYEDGSPVDDLYTLAMKDSDGKEIKEWAALMHYLSSFEEKNGVPEIPEEMYKEAPGRKVRLSEGGSALFFSGGFWIAAVIIILILLVLFLLIMFSFRMIRLLLRLFSGKKNQNGEQSAPDSPPVHR